MKLRRVRLAAGKGVAGANGALAPYTYPTQVALNGNGASGGSGGAPKACACPSGAGSTGGE